MLRIIGDSFCDIIAGSMESLPKLGGDVLANISLVAGGSGLNSAVHAANYCKYRDVPVSIELVTAVGRDFQGDICMQAVDTERIHLVCAREHTHGTGTCIVLSGLSDRSFVTDRACVGHMSLSWYDSDTRGFEGIGHVHAAGFFNCTTLITELPQYFKEVR
jgi:sugar/nucleoside kinase (ribokinase family)